MTMPTQVQLSDIFIYPTEFAVTDYEQTPEGKCYDEYALRDGDQDKLDWDHLVIREDSEGERFLLVWLYTLEDLCRFCKQNNVDRIDFTKPPVVRLRCP